jgi:hypothetical protein
MHALNTMFLPSERSRRAAITLASIILAARLI